MPSIGFCSAPLTEAGATTPAASRSVGAMSITWWNWERSPPLSLILLGHEMTMPLRVPPK